MDLWLYEKQMWSRGFNVICGVDEAGAGPLAGPVYAAAVILPHAIDIPGLRDSKKLSPKRREALYEVITDRAISYGIARAEVEEVDTLNILNARILAMQRAIDALNVTPDFCLVDGNRDHGNCRSITASPHITIIRGDSQSASIAAASILAKVSRDRFVCEELDVLYPQYQFARHKGYGTKLHYDMLNKYGSCPAHRKTFLKKWEARRQCQ